MRLSIRPILKLAAIAAAATFSLSAQAVPGWTGGSLATSGSDQLYGWIFTANSTFDVSALGVYDTDGDGLSIAHDVGLFNRATQALIVSTTLGPGVAGALDAGFRYTALGSNVQLTADDYVIVMTMPVGTADTQFINASAPTTDASISYITSAFDSGSVLAFPNPINNGAFKEGMFGPNFEIVPPTCPNPKPMP